MLKFVIDKIRQAPGPLKNTRLVATDLAEEIIDLIGHFLKKQNEKDATPCSCGCPSPYQVKPTPISDQPQNNVAKGQQVADNSNEKSSLDIDPELLQAINKNNNKRKQDFKVLAILLDIKQKNMGSVSAKHLAKHGEEIGLKIRHENARKVIRDRLDKLVLTQAQNVENSTIFRYEISSAGVEYLKTNYF